MENIFTEKDINDLIEAILSTMRLPEGPDSFTCDRCGKDYPIKQIGYMGPVIVPGKGTVITAYTKPRILA